MISSLLPLQRLLFHNILWRTNSESVHLTFDDGPHPVATPKLLDLLDKKNVRATFFLLGKNVAKYPEIAQRIQKEGHVIGNHSFSHANLLLKSRSDVEHELRSADGEIQNVIGVKPRFFRPPYGYLNPTIIKVSHENGYRTTLWSVDVRDFANPPLSTMSHRAKRRLSPGSIFLMHDNDFTQNRIVETVSHLIDIIKGRGYRLSTLPSK